MIWMEVILSKRKSIWIEVINKAGCVNMWLEIYILVKLGRSEVTISAFRGLLLFLVA